MKVTAIGAGNANSRINGNTCFLLEETYNNKVSRFLIDYGRTVPDLLTAVSGITPNMIDYIYISHAHSDHCGGLEDLAFLVYDWGHKPQRYDDYLTNKYPDGRVKPYWKLDKSYKKYAPVLIANEILMQELWNETLKGGLATMEGFAATLETFFEPKAIAPNEVFSWCGWEINLIQQVHVMTGSVTKSSFGLIFKKPGHKTVYFTTDSQHCSPEQMEVFYKDADIIFQDCELIGCDMRFQEGENKPYTGNAPVVGRAFSQHKCFMYTSRVHANYCKLAGYPSANAIRLDDETKAKMLLCHYQDFKLMQKIDPMIDREFTFDWDAQAKKDGFAGFVSKGSTYKF